ncbi:MAG: TetR family transcriptional regulator [Actinomycetaceae bacterium]|nr:TetR family transcriptional regulator [Actinomycetaceae bacterium]
MPRNSSSVSQKIAARHQVLIYARRHFTRRPYTEVKIHEIADDSGVSISNIRRLFGSKQALFREAFSLPPDPIGKVRQLLEPGIPGAGERIARWSLNIWEHTLAMPYFPALLRAAGKDLEDLPAFDSWLQAEVEAKLIDVLPGPDPHVRAQFIVAELIGVLVMRHCMYDCSISSMPVKQIVSHLSRNIQHHLEGPIGFDTGGPNFLKHKVLK